MDKSNWAEIGGELRQIRTIEPENINQLSMNGEWELIELAVDSGATESVIPADALPGIPTIAGAAQKRGVKYQVANGDVIENLGEKKIVALTEDFTEKKLDL